jgi:hypothetical protein
MNRHPRANNLHPRPPITQPADPSYRLIALTQDQVTAVDAADYDWLMQWYWYAWWNNNAHAYYAVRTMTEEEDPGRGRIYMHRAIAGMPEAPHVDHKDQDSLNNRRYNLRAATTSQNGFNRPVQVNSGTGFKGVHLDKRYGTYQASIKVNRKSKHLGSYPTAEEAARVRDKAAIELHGEFACLNFPEEHERTVGSVSASNPV